MLERSYSRPAMRRRPGRILAAAAVTIGVAACGSAAHPTGGGTTRSAAARGPQPASLMLDFTPNAIHVGIYAALARRLDARNGLRLHVEVPGASTDAISELEAGRVDFAILDIHDLAIARAKHAPIVGILPIVEEPLAAVIAAPSVHSPRQLAGRAVGVTGDPSDLAVLDSIVTGSGGNPKTVRKIDIGYDAVADLLSGRVAAATSFWNDEGVTLDRRKPGYHVFRVTRYGAPSYPELVVCATRAGLREHPELARDLVRTLTEGYDAAIAHPQAAAHALEHQVSGLDPSLVSAELPGETRFGIVSRPPDVGAMFDLAFTRH